MNRLLPRFELARWSGFDHADNDALGWLLAIEWLGFVIEFSGGKVKR